MKWEIITTLVLLICISSVIAYGEQAADGHPTWQERAAQVYMNAVRLSPSRYKELYMNGYSPSPSGILVDSRFVSTIPLYMEPRLTAAAFFHSTDMATNNCFQHDSCDGTNLWVRIARYYNCSGTLAENAAAGNADPLATTNQWLCDKVGNACADDYSSGDGHRKNIMGVNYRVVGNGYASRSGSTYTNYWTQDFGGAPCIPPNTPIYGGSHHTRSGTTKFMATYYNTTANPASATVTIQGNTSALTLELGTAGAGHYVFSQPADTACRRYYFTFGANRYPETGCLVTYGEGSCTTTYDSTCPGDAPPSNTDTTAQDSSASFVATSFTIVCSIALMLLF